jgi:hypothetical protein
MRLAIALTGLLILAGCSADQSAKIPPDPNAPFPLNNAKVLGQPEPGTLLIEQRGILANRHEVQQAAEFWCDGPVSVSPIQSDRGGRFRAGVSVVWLVRCQ